MNSVAVILALACAICVSAAPSTFDCSVPSQQSISALNVLQPYKDSWMLVKSNNMNDTCVNFQYIMNRNGNAGEATAVYRNFAANVHMTGKAIVNAAETSWECHHDDGEVVTFQASYLAPNNQSFCIYSCNGQAVSSVRCFARTPQGVADVKQEVEMSGKPVYAGLGITDVYNCGMATPTPAFDCSKPSTLKISALKVLQPYKDSWMLVKSNMPKTDTCVNFQYIMKRNGNDSEATAVYRNFAGNVHMTGKAIVNANETSWECHHDDGSVVTFQASYLAANSESFCIYSCTNQAVSSVRCMARTPQGVADIKQEVEKSGKPVYAGLGITDVYKCSL